MSYDSITSTGWWTCVFLDSIHVSSLLLNNYHGFPYIILTHLWKELSCIPFKCFSTKWYFNRNWPWGVAEDESGMKAIQKTLFGYKRFLLLWPSGSIKLLVFTIPAVENWPLELVALTSWSSSSISVFLESCLRLHIQWLHFDLWIDNFYKRESVYMNRIKRSLPNSESRAKSVFLRTLGLFT